MSPLGLGASGLVALLVTPVGGVLVLAVAALAIGSAVLAERTGVHRGARTARWAGIGIGVLSTLVIGGLSVSSVLPGRLGLGALVGVGPLVGAAIVVGAILLGERTLPAHSERQRVGLLAHRGPRTMFPTLAVVVAALSALALLTVTIASTVFASPDDQGRAGRSFAYSVADPRIGTLSGSRGPFPGSWYTVPVWSALVLLLAVTAWALVVIVRRRPSDDPADALLRRRSAAAVLGAASAGMSIVAIGVGVVTAAVIGAAGQTAAMNGIRIAIRGASTAVSIALVAALVAAVCLLLGLAMVLAPALFARRDARAGRATAASRAVEVAR